MSLIRIPVSQRYTPELANARMSTSTFQPGSITNASMVTSHVYDYKDYREPETKKSLKDIIAAMKGNENIEIHEEFEEEASVKSEEEEEKKFSLEEQLEKIRKHIIAKSAQELIPAEYSHLFGKVEKTKAFKPKKKKIITKVITKVV